MRQIQLADRLLCHRSLIILAVNNCFALIVGIFYALSESEKVLQGAIQQLCGMWWEKGLEGKEQLGKTAFIMLLRKSLKSKTVLVC